MNKNVEFLYKLLNEYFMNKMSTNDSIEIRRVLGDLSTFGDTEKERYINISALSNAYTLVLAEANVSALCGGNFCKYDFENYKTQLSLTFLSNKLLEGDLYVPMYLKLALEDILNFLWDPKAMSGDLGYNDLNVTSSSLDLYLDSAVDDYVKFKENISKDLRTCSETKMDSIKVRKDSNGDIIIMEPSTEFTVLLNKFNIEYIISLLIIIVIGMLTTSKGRV